jgi:hypothetical protein
MDILDWYVTDGVFRNFLNKVFEKALFDFSVHLKLKTKTDFHAGKIYFALDMYYNRGISEFGFHQDQTAEMPVEYFTLSFVDEKPITDSTARTGEFKDAFIGTGVIPLPIPSGTHRSGYFIISNQFTLGISNTLLLHTTPDLEYDISKPEKSGRLHKYQNRTTHLTETPFTELRGERVRRDIQVEVANFLRTNTSRTKRSFERVWFSKSIPETDRTPHSDHWRHLNHFLHCDSFYERTIDKECVARIKRDLSSNPRLVGQFELITLRRCVLNTTSVEKTQAYNYRRDNICTGNTCIPMSEETDERTLYCDVYVAGNIHVDNIAFSLKKPKTFILFDPPGTKLASVASVASAASASSAASARMSSVLGGPGGPSDAELAELAAELEEAMKSSIPYDSEDSDNSDDEVMKSSIPDDEDFLVKPDASAAAKVSADDEEDVEYKDIIEGVCEVIAKLDETVLVEQISSYPELETLLLKIAMGKKSKKHKTKKSKTKKSKTKKSKTKKSKTKKSKTKKSKTKKYNKFNKFNKFKKINKIAMNL